MDCVVGNFLSAEAEPGAKADAGQAAAGSSRFRRAERPRFLMGLKAGSGLDLLVFDRGVCKSAHAELTRCTSCLGLEGI